MANPEWGTKRQCPKCGTRFYDLGENDPIVCIDCGHKFKPEIILKSKMTPIDLSPEEKDDDDDDEGLLDEKDILDDNIEDDDIEIDADDNTVVLSDDDDETNVAAVVVKPNSKNADE